jgi:uncharacterized repeat protein (TIGR01451 family)
MRLLSHSISIFILASLVILCLMDPVLAVTENYIAFDESFQTQLSAPNNEKIYLSILGRIEYPYLAGGGQMLRIRVNGYPVECSQLINKNLSFTLQNGRTYSYCDDSYKMWMLFYSPDFFSNNIAQSGYRVLQGDAYEYTFDVTSLVNRDKVNILIFENTGSDYIKKYQNEFTQTDINRIKALKVVISDIELKGIGAEIVPIITTSTVSTTSPTSASLTKSTNPQVVKQNQTETITVTIENTGTTQLSDIEVIDEVPSEFIFLSGDTQTAYSTLKPGESRTIQYNIQSKGSGKFTLDAATARYADQRGNYSTIKSNTPTIEVLTPLVDQPITTKAPGFNVILCVGGILAAILIFRKLK